MAEPSKKRQNTGQPTRSSAKTLNVWASSSSFYFGGNMASIRNICSKGNAEALRTLLKHASEKEINSADEVSLKYAKWLNTIIDWLFSIDDNERTNLSYNFYLFFYKISSKKQKKQKKQKQMRNRKRKEKKEKNKETRNK